jgi:hypothetical protein
VPADPSSPIPAALTQLAHAQPFHASESPHLLAYLASVPDPRAARGRRHPLVAMLGLAAAAVLAGARSIAAIAEWAADAPQPVRAALGARHHAPGHCSVPAEATIRRTLSAWTSTPWPPRSAPGFPTAAASSSAAGQSRSMAGRCEAKRDGRQVHLLACMDHTTRAVLAQRQVDGAPVRSPPSNPLLAGLDLPGGHHRRRTAHPPGRRRVPGHPKAGPSRRPHPRPRPRPRRAPHPQGRHRQPLRLPARRPGPAGHPQGL